MVISLFWILTILTNSTHYALVVISEVKQVALVPSIVYYRTSFKASLLPFYF